MEFFSGFLFALVLLLLSIDIKIPVIYLPKVNSLIIAFLYVCVGVSSPLDHCPRTRGKNVNRKEVKYFEIKCTILISCCERLGDEEKKKKTNLRERKISPRKKRAREKEKQKNERKRKVQKS